MAARWIYHAHECAWDTGGLTVESMAGNRRKHVTESLIQDEARGFTASNDEVSKGFELPMNPNVICGNPAVRRVVKGSRSAGDEASEEQFATHLNTVQQIRQTAGTKRGAEDDVMVSPTKRAHTIPFPLTQTLLHSATGRNAMPVPRPDVKVGFDAAVQFRDHYNGEVLDWSLKITGTNKTRPHGWRSLECPHEDTSPRNRRQRGSSTRTCSTDPREPRSVRELRHEITLPVSAPEHYVSARACRMMSKGSYASACIIRCVSCILPCLARERCAGKASERFQIER